MALNPYWGAYYGSYWATYFGGATSVAIIVTSNTTITSYQGGYFMPKENIPVSGKFYNKFLMWKNKKNRRIR